MESKAYEIYKQAVGGKTWNGEDMKQFQEMPQNIRNAWIAIDETYKPKPRPKTERKQEDLPLNSKSYEEYQKKHKNAKDFLHLPDKLKKVWINVDKNEDKFLIAKEEKPKKEKKQKPQKEDKPVIEILTKKNGLVKSDKVFKKKTH